MKLPETKVLASYTKFIGGLDQISDAMTFPPGSIYGSSNYVSTTDGGYERIDGYERYSGQPSPSDAIYFHLTVSFIGSVSLGDTITGSDSSSTGVVIAIGTDFLDVTKVSTAFQLETFTVGGVIKGTISVINSSQITVFADATSLAASADNYRLDISKPAGDFPIRGLGILKGILYCFVDNIGGTAGEIYKSTTSGWSLISLLDEISFSTGAGLVSDGDTITQISSGATAVVSRVVLESGAWGTDAVGRLILSSITGTFDSSNVLQVNSVTQCLATSSVTAITILPGGRYEIEESNFGGDIDTTRLYGCDGVNKGFEFDGTVYVPIKTGLIDDTPLHVATHKLQLFFSYRSSSFNSSPGKPYEWSAVTGASEIGIGDTITGFNSLAGEVLGIFGKNRTKQLLGNNIDDFSLDNVSVSIGAYSYSIQQLQNTFSFDNRGIILTTPSDTYGNFQQPIISNKIQDVLNSLKLVFCASTIYKTKNQYRIYGSDGSGVCMTQVGDTYDFTVFDYPDYVSCTTYGEDVAGNNVVFFGTFDGMVMQADKGSSFDGADIEAFISFPFNNFKSPTTLKTFRKGTIELSSKLYTEMRFSTELSYGTFNLPPNLLINQTIYGPGGFWDINNWENFFYDQETTANPSFRINGTGINLNLTLYNKSCLDLGHKLDGFIVHYTPRRLQR